MILCNTEWPSYGNLAFIKSVVIPLWWGNNICVYFSKFEYMLIIQYTEYYYGMLNDREILGLLSYPWWGIAFRPTTYALCYSPHHIIQAHTHCSRKEKEGSTPTKPISGTICVRSKSLLHAQGYRVHQQRRCTAEGWNQQLHYNYTGNAKVSKSNNNLSSSFHPLHLIALLM